MQFADFWYVVAQSGELRPQTLLSRKVLNEWLVVFRGRDGQPVALRDRCLHRSSRLSCGRMHHGQVQCPYHGWRYDEKGQVVAVPSEGPDFQAKATRHIPRYATQEQDGYVYVRLSDAVAPVPPFPMPCYQKPGWATVRVINTFQNNVTNCVENFIDIPHTVFVHPGIFRRVRQQQLEMTVTRCRGTVRVEYHHETSNLGWWSRFLNQKGQTIQHRDSFYMPNITCVEYRLGWNRHLFITSQSVPESDTTTRVYTDVTFNYGPWNGLARPFVYGTAQQIIRQDVKILAIQADTIARYGNQFTHTPADTIHDYVESIRHAIEAGKDPRELPERATKVTFWI